MSWTVNECDVTCFYFQVDARTGLGFRQQQRQGIIGNDQVWKSLQQCIKLERSHTGNPF